MSPFVWVCGRGRPGALLQTQSCASSSPCSKRSRRQSSYCIVCSSCRSCMPCRQTLRQCMRLLIERERGARRKQTFDDHWVGGCLVLVVAEACLSRVSCFLPPALCCFSTAVAVGGDEEAFLGWRCFAIIVSLSRHPLSRFLSCSFLCLALPVCLFLFSFAIPASYLVPRLLSSISPRISCGAK